MDALILSRTAALDSDLSALASAVPGFASGSPKLLALSGGAHAEIAAADGGFNLYAQKQLSSYDRVVIGPSVILFDNAWARAFLRHALSLVKPGGTLSLVRTKAGARGGRALLPLAAARAFLGGEETASGDAVVLTVRRREALPPPVKSTLTAFLEDEPGLTTALAAYYRDKAIPADLLAGMAGISHPSNPIGGVSALEDPSHPSAENVERQKRLSSSDDDGYATYVASLNPYMVDGVRYKHALVTHIMRSCAPELAERPISVADIGAAYGLLPIELALDKDFEVVSATAVELGLAYAIGADRIVRRCDGLDGRFRFAHARAENFAFEPPLDMVTFIGALLYVAKDALRAVLDKAWNSLAPGGLLIIHENIRRSDFNQADLMFSADELDTLMGRYAPIRYFMSTAAVELTREQAGDKSVFRVVKKPATAGAVAG